jgi:hypothetical protein
MPFLTDFNLLVSTYIKVLIITEDQKFFTRKKNQDGLSCKKDQISESFKIFFKRLVNIVAYEDDVCTDLKILSDMSAGYFLNKFHR